MKAFLQEYLAYTRSERRGILALVLLCLMILAFPSILPLLFPKETSDFSTFQKDIAAFETQQEKAASASTNLFVFDPNAIDQAGLQDLGLSEKVANTYLNYRRQFGDFERKEDLKKVYGFTETLFQELEPFIQIEAREKEIREEIVSRNTPKLRPVTFDPNTVRKSSLVGFGLSEKVASNIINYREKVGRFEQKEDLKKLYSLSDSDYEQLATFIEIEPLPVETTDQIASNDIANSNTVPDAYEARELSRIVLDINKAGAEEWQQLRGIGPTYANRIVKFRAALGGFSSTQQVAETYGLPDSTFQNILFSLRPSPIFKKLKINELDAKALKQHPYIKDWKTANIIVNYRAQHGKYESIDDLRKVRVLSEELIRQLSPYLEF